MFRTIGFGVLLTFPVAAMANATHLECAVTTRHGAVTSPQAPHTLEVTADPAAGNVTHKVVYHDGPAKGTTSTYPSTKGTFTANELTYRVAAGDAWSPHLDS